MSASSKSRAEQISGGVFIIGLGLLFLDVLPWWPGILLIIGLSSLAQGLSEGRRWYSVQGALWMIGLSLLFWGGFSIGMLLILLGGSMLAGYLFRPPMFRSGHDDDDYDADSYDLSPALSRDYGDPFADAANDSFGLADELDDKPKRKIKVDDDLTYYDGDSLR